MFESAQLDQEFLDLLHSIVSNSCLHARWLNTLSYLENCGARKIALCEHPTKVKEEMLKHAAEEFRHAYHLKQQILKISPAPLESYSLPSLLGGMKSLHYLNALDIAASRYLKGLGLQRDALKTAAYLTVTYAIEVRASCLYPLYHKILREKDSKVQVKSIVLEEEEHLNEMRRELDLLENGNIYSQNIVTMESKLFASWIQALKSEIKNINHRITGEGVTQKRYGTHIQHRGKN
jgi:rubrerythrin